MTRHEVLRAFDLAYPVLMILFPAVLSTFVRDRGQADEARRKKARRLGAATWLTTAGLIASVAAAWAAELTWVCRFAWLSVFPLYFGLAFPWAMSKDPAWGPRPKPPVRAARLTPRHDPPAGPAWVLIIAAAVWAASLAGVSFMAWRSGTSAAWAMLSFPFASGVWLGVATYARSGRLREPEPLPGRPAPELERAYDEFRLFLRRVFFWLGSAAVAVFAAAGFGAAAASADLASERLVSLVAGGSGAALGFAGAIVGTAGTLKRVRLQRLYQEAITAGHPVESA